MHYFNTLLANVTPGKEDQSDMRGIDGRKNYHSTALLLSKVVTVTVSATG